MATLTIPPFTVPQGLRVLGPVAIRRWTQLNLVLDMQNLVSTMTIRVERSDDGGASWHPVLFASFDPGGPWINPLDGTLGFNVPIVIQVPNGVPGTHVQATLDNPTAFASTGGSLTVN
jgi:hypothetical protein